MILVGGVAAGLAVLPLVVKWQLGMARVWKGLCGVIAAAWGLGIVVHQFVAMSSGAQLAFGAVAVLAAALALSAHRFYRDPERQPPPGDHTIVSPADGTVVYVKTSQGGHIPVSTKHGRRASLHELAGTHIHEGEAVVIGISMSFLDVHVNRSPIAGRIQFRRHFAGRFGSLRDPENLFANERATTVIQGKEVEIAVVQIASRLVRQIVSLVKLGQQVEVGQRIGVIRFGSQVDVVLPSRDDLHPLVHPGDRVQAGTSVLALLQRDVRGGGRGSRSRGRQNSRSSPASSAVKPDVQVAVLGAGPHGISAAVHLRRAGQEVHVFGNPMSFWRSMPKGMMLRSNMSATNMVEPKGPLSLRAHMDETDVEFDHPVPLERFTDYGRWVQRKAVPDLDERLVTEVDVGRDHFTVSLADGDVVSARRVVVAAGIGSFAHIPPGFEHLPPEVMSHTGQHHDLSAFEGQRVVVVGGGQSALECAALMQESGAEVEALIRSERVVWLRRVSPRKFMGPFGGIAYAPTDVGPLWYSRFVATPAFFRQFPRGVQTRVAYRSIRPACAYFVRTRLDPVRLTLGTALVAAKARADQVRLTLSDGSTREVDHVMFGTGYRVDVSRYPFLGPSILAGLDCVGGYPVLRPGLESSIAGLHFTGAPASWSFGPIMRFVSGSWYGGRAVASAIRRSALV